MSTLNLASSLLQSYKRLLRKLATYNKLALVQINQQNNILLHQQSICPHRNLFLPNDFKIKALYKSYYNIYILFYFLIAEITNYSYISLWVLSQYLWNIHELQLNQRWRCFLNLMLWVFKEQLVLLYNSRTLWYTNSCLSAIPSTKYPQIPLKAWSIEAW